MAIFLLTSGLRIWCVVGYYVPPNNEPAIHCIEQSLEAAPKGMKVVLLGLINIRLREPQDSREEDIATALADSGMVNITAHFMPRRRYRGAESWAW